jgi:hypothetical protein
MKKSRIARALLSCILCLTMQAELVDAQANPATEATRIERIKKSLSESTTDPRSRVEVCLKDKRRMTGHLGEMRDTGFILIETPSGSPLMIAYQDVAKITNKNHSTFTKFGIAALVGGTALLTVVAIVAGATGQ